MKEFVTTALSFPICFAETRLRRRIIAARMKRVATEQPFERHETAAEETIFFYRRERIRGT
jgi:hypothetical protein